MIRDLSRSTWNAGGVPPGARRLLLPCPRVRTSNCPTHPPHSTPSSDAVVTQYSSTAHCTCTLQSVGRVCNLYSVRAYATAFSILERKGQPLVPCAVRSRPVRRRCTSRPLALTVLDHLHVFRLPSRRPFARRSDYVLSQSESVFALDVSQTTLRACSSSSTTPDTRRPTVSFRILVLRTVAHWLARYSSRPPTTRLWQALAKTSHVKRNPSLRPQVRSILGRRSPAGTATTDAWSSSQSLIS